MSNFLLIFIDMTDVKFPDMSLIIGYEYVENLLLTFWVRIHVLYKIKHCVQFTEQDSYKTEGSVL